MDEAAKVARDVNMSIDAYGKLCWQMVPVVQLIGGHGVDTLTQAVTTMGDGITSVREAAALYDTVEQGNTKAFG